MNYKYNWITWFESGLETTNEPIDNITIFKNFTQAKQALLKEKSIFLKQVQNDYKMTKLLIKKDVF